MANPQQLLAVLQQNRPAAIAIIAVVVLGIGIIGYNIIAGGGGGGGASGRSCDVKLEGDQRVLAESMQGVGKALEVQALVAKAGITVNRTDDETGKKAKLEFAKGTTMCQRDTALLMIAQSGLMDKNTGLEIFEKGDLTASREEKRIKLIRAQQGELARLIRKLDTVSDATVSFSIPEQTIFKKQQKAMSVSVQVSTKDGERLTRDKVRTIINLVVGSVQQVDAKHVALSDTNGNTYNSVLESSSELEHRMDEQDQRMKDKVSRQLNKLVGVGNYVVTVSTQLREEVQEVMTSRVDPNTSAVTSKQRFSENLNAKSGSAGLAGGPASGFVPKGMSSSSSGSSSSNRGYSRVGEEVTFANTKTQMLQTRMPGMIEDISIAVTLDADHFPRTLDPNGQQVDMDERALQRLIARAASPQVRPDNVSIARISFGAGPSVPIQTSAQGLPEDKVDYMPYAVGAVLVLLAFLMFMFRGSAKDPRSEQNEQEIQRLQDVANQQQQQLQATQQQTQLLMEAQQRTLSGTEAPMAGQLPQQATAPAQDLKQTLNEIKETIEQEDLDDEDIDTQIRSWIESS